MLDSGKEALERLFGSYVSSKCYGINYKEDDEDYNIILKDLDRLEKLEIANKNNEGLVRENVELINKNLELGKENQELRLFANKLNNTNFILSSELAEAEKYKQAIEILKENLHISLVEEPIYPNCANYYINQYNKFGNGCLTIITQENFDLLKEILEDDK